VFMRERGQRSTGDRVLDTAAGALLSVAALVPLALVAGAVLKSVEESARFLAVLGGLVALAVSVWCLRTSWRLISGRPRNDGGRLSPWLIAAAGVIFAAWGSFGVAELGRAGLSGAMWMGAASIGCFTVAWERFRRGRLG
jgi:hypothetical protein